MKITNSCISLSSEHSELHRDVQNESLHVWAGGHEHLEKRGTLWEMAERSRSSVVEISKEAEDLFKEQMRSLKKAEQSQQVSKSTQLSSIEDLKVQLVTMAIKILTGKDIKIRAINLDNLDAEKAKLQEQLKQIKLDPAKFNTNKLEGWGLNYQYSEFHLEQESVNFNAEGIVHTADGKEIDISLAVGMTRQFMSQQNISIKAGDALKDPLVINFNAPAAQLTANKFQFDLDSDGKEDQISFVGPGSGYLALDRNNDGKINDGHELFGPDSGNGFDDLAQYDSDGNHWIDENDPIFNKLRIWTKDANGQDQLLALGEVGVGAIYLGNVSTEFALKDNQNNLQGQLRQSGFFLKEDGQAGTVQQIDLAI